MMQNRMAGTVSRDQILRRERVKEKKIVFRQDCQLYRFMTSMLYNNHKYISSLYIQTLHTYTPPLILYVSYINNMSTTYQ